MGRRHAYAALLALCLASLSILPGAARAGSLQDALNQRWRGAWVLLTAPVASDCGELYTNNEVRGGRVLPGGGAVRFETGELAYVHKVDVKRSRVDVLLDLAVPYLLPYRDGPFTLYREAHCKVELLFDLPRPMIAAGELAGPEAALAGVLERRADDAAARASTSWNRRRRAPYPADYEETLAAHEEWKVERINAEVAARIEKAAREANRAANRVHDDPDYLAGFAAGVRAMRSAYFGDCESLLASGFSSSRKSRPGGHDRDWNDGFEDGQRLVYHLELAERLPRCFVPEP